jgi:hypothetical protein
MSVAANRRRSDGMADEPPRERNFVPPVVKAQYGAGCVRVLGILGGVVLFVLGRFFGLHWVMLAFTVGWVAVIIWGSVRAERRLRESDRAEAAARAEEPGASHPGPHDASGAAGPHDPPRPTG